MTGRGGVAACGRSNDAFAPDNGYRVHPIQAVGRESHRGAPLAPCAEAADCLEYPSFSLRLGHRAPTPFVHGRCAYLVGAGGIGSAAYAQTSTPGRLGAGLRRTVLVYEGHSVDRALDKRGKRGQSETCVGHVIAGADSEAIGAALLEGGNPSDRHEIPPPPRRERGLCNGR